MTKSIKNILKKTKFFQKRITKIKILLKKVVKKLNIPIKSSPKSKFTQKILYTGDTECLDRCG